MAVGHVLTDPSRRLFGQSGQSGQRRGCSLLETPHRRVTDGRVNAKSNDTIKQPRARPGPWPTRVLAVTLADARASALQALFVSLTI